MELFKDQSSHPKLNAQRNLCGRTHCVDDETLRWRKSRVLSARSIANGLFFAITTSDALDMNNTKRGFRYVLFNVFGTVISRPDLERAYKTHAAATKAMWAASNSIDAYAHTRKAIEGAREAYDREIQRFTETVDALDKHANSNAA